jgi:hypothetical protein
VSLSPSNLARPPAPRRHPNIFTAAEAAAYLGLDSERSLETLRRDFHLIGHRPAGKAYLYWKAELDRVAAKMFGVEDEKPCRAKRAELPTQGVRMP